MSRAFDLVLLGLVVFLGWNLVNYEPNLAATPDGILPVTAVVRAGGTESLAGLGILLVPEDDLQISSDDDLAPHQIAPWQRERTTQVLVPMPGRYRVRWALQGDRPPPRRARDVMRELPPFAKLPDQIVEITEDSIHAPIAIDLPAEHARGLRQLMAAD